jgi:pimeloyl-ACP methyl ester carboxylesterase
MQEYLLTHRNENQDAAIVFVHGFLGDPRKTWGQFPDFLQAEPQLKGWDIFSIGYPTSLWFDLVGIWRANPDIRAVAELFRTTASVQLARYKTLTLITHSMGGLVIQHALVNDGELASRVGQVFFFGVPSDGLVKAAFFKFWKRSLDDMAEGGTFILALRKAWKEKFLDSAPGFRFWAIAGDQDEFVPRRSSLGPFPEALVAVVPGDHLGIVKPAAPTALSVQLVLAHLIGKAAPSGLGDAARTAVEEREFHEAVRLLEPHEGELDEAGLVQLALALEGIERQEDAIRVLEKASPDQTDAIGVLAGRLKRRWLVERRKADALRAQELYQQGFDCAEAAQRHDQAFYHGINVAFMTLAYGNDLDGAKAMAHKVLEHCRRWGGAPLWRLATEGEANLLLGETDLAIAKYRETITNQPQPKPRQLDSMFQQAIRVVSLLDAVHAADRLRALFRGEPT